MMKKTNSPGSSGGKGPLRNWSIPSYSASDGRALTSIGDEKGRGGPPDSADHCRNPSAQIPDAFDAIDKRRTQNPTPVKNRPLG